MNTIVCGSLAFDRIMNFPGKFEEHILPDQIHKINVSFFIERLEQRRGGAGGNIPYSLVLLGEQPMLASSIGEDGRAYLSALQKYGINCDAVALHSDATTACFYGITDQHNNQIGGFHEGADARPSTLDLSAFSAADTLFIAAPRNCKQDTLRFTSECKQLGIQCLVDLGQTIPMYSDDELKMIITGSDVVFVNDYELQLVRKKIGVSEDGLVKMTRVFVTTLGEKGSRVQTAEEDVRIPACGDVTLKDPTGAGDAYRAGYVKGMILGRSLQECARLGSTVAAYALEHVGTQEHTFTLVEFAARYEKNYGEPCPQLNPTQEALTVTK